MKKCKFPLYVFVAEALSTPLLEFYAFVDQLAECGSWGIRMFGQTGWSTVKTLPWHQAVWKGTPVVYRDPDTHIDFPVYDHRKKNAFYWSNLRSRLAYMKLRGQRAVISAYDNCDIKDGLPNHGKFRNPFMCSLQTMSREEYWPDIFPREAVYNDPEVKPSPGGFYGNARKPWHKAWVVDLIKAVKASGVDFVFEPVNEVTDLGWDAQGHPEIPYNWYRWLYGIMRGFLGSRLPKARIIVHSGKPEYSKGLGQYWQHGVVKPEDIDPRYFFYSGDGGAKGRSLIDIDIKGRVGLSVDDGQKIARLIKAHGKGGLEIMPKILNKYNDNMVKLPLFNPLVCKKVAEESWK
jgi:hypothetical protein